MTAHADARTEAAARILAGAWRDGMLLDGLPEQCRPASAAEAHAIQDATLALLGAATGAYKVNAFPQGGHVRGIFIADRVLQAPATVPVTPGLAGVEPEIAFRFPQGVPPRDLPYREDELVGLAEAMPAFDVVESRYTDFMQRTQFERAADCLNAGWFIFGEPVRDWQQQVSGTLHLGVSVAGKPVFEGDGRHPFGDPFMPVVHWINARHTEGCPPGVVVTTGSYAGLIAVAAGDEVEARFAGFAPLHMRVGA